MIRWQNISVLCDFDNSSMKRQVGANDTICRTTDDLVALAARLDSFRNDRAEMGFPSPDYSPAGARVKSHLGTAKIARLDAMESRTETQNESMTLYRRRNYLVHEHSTTLTSMTESQETSGINAIHNH